MLRIAAQGHRFRRQHPEPARNKAIRRKLGPAKQCLETVRGIGYRFSDPMRD
jgi:hypothetical protein